MSRTAVLASILIASLLGLAACGGSAEDHLQKARQHLAAGAYAEAAVAANQGLAAGAEGPVAWRLELSALEGEARSARTADVLARLERLAGAWSGQVSGSLYVQTAGQLKEAGDAEGAIGVLDAGAQRYPDDPDLAQAIERLKTTGSSDEIERLRTLGYVE
jgi:tetratricopeptide (TPR) repeat protein